MTEETSIICNQWYKDLSKAEYLNIFNDALESIQSYRSNWTIISCRKISLQVEKLLENFLRFKFSKDEKNFITEILKRDNEVIRNTKYFCNSAVKLLRSFDPNGFSLLGIEEKINIKILKKLYRVAAKKYHPDLGGSLENMQKINEAYTLFHNIIISFKPRNKIEKIVPIPQSWDDLLFAIYIILACINGDFFAVDKAIKYFKKSYLTAKSSKSKYIGYLIAQLVSAGRIIDSICITLSKFRMSEELVGASKIRSYFEYRQTKDTTDFKPVMRDSKYIWYSHIYGTRISLDHPERAKNAYSFGKIDKARYDRTMKRFKIKQDDESDTISLIDTFILQTGFIQKISNVNYNVKSINPKVINYPNVSQRRFVNLNNAQKYEYLKAYSRNGNGKLVDKYYKIRTQEILLGLIKNFDQLDLEKLEKEINFFCNHFGDKYVRYQILNDFLEYFKSLLKMERSEKLRILSDLDIDFPATDWGVEWETIPNKKRISCNDYYLEFVKNDLKDLKDFKFHLKIPFRKFIGRFPNIFHKNPSSTRLEAGLS